MSEFHFLRPEWFWALIPLAALLAGWRFHRARGGRWSRLVDPQLQPHVLTGGGNRRRKAGPWLFALAGLLAITALAGPAWKRLPQPVFKDQSALVIALDLSRSMLARDVKPSRLERAKLKLVDILRARKTGRTALVVFAADAFTVTPLTDDIETITAHVSDLSVDLMPAQGSRPDRAAEKAISLLANAGAQQGEVLLITDGAAPEHLQAAAERLRQAGHTLLLLGAGTADGAPIPADGGGFIKDRSGSIVIDKLNEPALRQAGRYQRMSVNERDYQSLLDSSNRMPNETELTDLNTDTWRDEGPWLLPPVLLLALLAFRRGVLVLALLCLLPLPRPAAALSWDGLWLNDDQRGSRALEAGQAGEAAQLFDDPAWRAAAQYRAGDYEKAVETLEGLDTAEAFYNKGNAQAKLGRTDQAIASYEQALEHNPDHEDARYNLELLQRQKQQQQQQQQQQNKNSREQNRQGGQQQQQQQSNRGGERQNQQQSQRGRDARPKDGQKDDASRAGRESQSDKNEEDVEALRQAMKQQSAGEQRQDEQDKPRQAQAAIDDSNPLTPEQQATEQWLRRIPDDPGGLLRRKFRYQYRQQQDNPSESEQW